MGRALTGALLVLLLLAAPAAAEPVGLELTVVQDDTRVTAAAAADVERPLVVFSTRETYGATALGRDAALDRTGEPIPGSFPDSDAGQALGIAANPERREHLLAWPEGGQLKARRLTALGAPVGAASFDVAPLAARPSPPDAIGVTYSTRTKEYLVAWTTGATIEARRVSDTGVLRGGVVVLSDLPDWTTGRAPHVGAHENGWYVVWTGQRANGASEIVGQGLDLDGDESGQERRLADGSSPTLAVDAKGEALVAWAGGDRVYAQRFNGFFERRSDNVEVARDARAPEVAWSPLGKRHLVVYRGASDRIRGRLLDAEGKVVGTEEEQISTDSNGRDPSVAALPSGDDFLVAWGEPTRGFARWVEALGGASGGTDYPIYGEYDPYAPYPGIDDLPYEPYPTYPYEPYDPGRYPDEPSRPGATESPTVGLSLLGSPTLRRLVGRGLMTRATCAAGCMATLTVGVDARTARRHGLPRTLARSTRRLREAGSATAALRPRLAVRRRLREVERLRVTVTLAVEPADGGQTVRRRRSVTLTG